MAIKKVQIETQEVEVVPWHEAVTFNPSSKADLLWLYELLKSLGITQMSVLEGMIGRAE
jgi:hypothetical protein